MKTLALTENWDIYMSDKKGIATFEDKKQLAQDIATSCRVWTGEYCFDTTRGIPYKYGVFGRSDFMPLLSEYVKSEAERIEGVKNARLFVNKDGRNAEVFIVAETEGGESIEVLNGLKL